jgi:adenosylcobinamide-GDP ribazoletransferase
VNRTDTARLLGFDILAGFGLLTRLPIRIDGARAAARGGQAAWAWPLVGAGVGALAALAGGLALALGAAPGAAAALALATQAMVTGALHEDGLADSADGLWGGWDKARRLAIMKDSHIGTYGVLALILVTLLRWTALAALFAQGTPWAALIAAGALSRAPMAVLMAALPNARGTGLSHSVGRPDGVTASYGVALALLIGAVALGWQGLGLALLAALTAAAVALIARARIGGQTGDILGATQQLCEAVVLTSLAGSLRS